MNIRIAAGTKRARQLAQAQGARRITECLAKLAAKGK